MEPIGIPFVEKAVARTSVQLLISSGALQIGELWLGSVPSRVNRTTAGAAAVTCSVIELVNAPAGGDRVGFNAIESVDLRPNALLAVISHNTEHNNSVI